MSAAINTFVGNYTSTGKHDATPKISISLHAGCVVRWPSITRLREREKGSFIRNAKHAKGT